MPEDFVAYVDMIAEALPSASKRVLVTPDCPKRCIDMLNFPFTITLSVIAR